MSKPHKYQVIRTLPDLVQLIGEYESILQAKFIMRKAKKHNAKGKYEINQKETDAYLKAEELSIDIALNK